MKIQKALYAPSAVAIALLLATFVNAQTTQIEVKYETLRNLGSAPVIAGFSNGSYDIFSVGSPASSALRTLAEVGAPSGFTGALAPPEGGPVFGNNPSPPIFTPNGGMNSAVFTVSNTNNTFNMASMLLPSNDWFVGTDNGVSITSLLGAAPGTTLQFDLSTVYDAGTESEDFLYSAGNPVIGHSGGANAGVNMNITSNPVSVVTGADPFSTFANIDAGFDTTAFDFSGTPIARVTLTTVPEPDAGVLALICFGGLAAVARRRRRE